MALRDTRVARMPRATFEWLLETSLPFTRFLLMQLNERLGQFIAQVESDRTLDVDTRVARCLAAMFHPHLYPGLEAMVHISQEEIGYLSGASRQRVNQALQLLEKEGLLRLDYGGIRILDLDRLATVPGCVTPPGSRSIIAGWKISLLRARKAAPSCWAPCAPPWPITASMPS